MPSLLLRSMLALTVGLALTGCQAQENQLVSGPESKKMEEPAAMDALGGGADDFAAEQSAPAARSRGMVAEAPAGSSQGKSAPAANKQEQQPTTAGLYIIRRGNVTLQVKDVRSSLQQVAAMVTAVGGFVADSNFSTSEGVTPHATLVLRVPAKHFDDLLDRMGGVGTVFNRGISSEDVSLSYVDTESRIRNLREGEASLRKILERSGKLSEVLEVERELSRVRGEIEQAQGRLRHLSNQVALATIQVTLTEKVQQVSTSPWAVIPSTIENAWQNVGRALAGTFARLAESSIWLVAYVLPLSVPVVVLYVLLGLGLRRWLVEAKAWLPDVWFIRVWLGVGVVGLTYAVPGLGGLLVMVAFIALGFAALAWLGQLVRGRLKKPEA